MIHLIKQSQEKKSVSFLTWRFRGRCSVESVNVNGSIALLYTSCPPVSKGGGCTEWTAEAKEVWPTIPIWTIGSHAFCDKMFGSVEYCTYSHRRLSSDTVPVGKTQPFYCMFLCHCEKRSYKCISIVLGSLQTSKSNETTRSDSLLVSIQPNKRCSKLLLVFTAAFQEPFTALGCRLTSEASLASMGLRKLLWSISAVFGFVLIVAHCKY